MRILITGSAGFIGFHTAKKLLEQGHTVVGVDNFTPYYDPNLKHARNNILLHDKGYIFYKADITDEKKINEIFAAKKPESVLHLAAQAGVRYSLEQPMLYADTNIKGTLAVLNACVLQHVKNCVVASSSSVYGNNPTPWNEAQSVDRPLNPYGASKRGVEHFAYAYHHVHALPITLLRFFTVYGPWGRPDMAYFKFADNISKGEPIEVYNNGNMRRDFTYIDDIADGIIAALEKPNKYQIYNLGNSHSEALEDFIAVLEKELGKKALKNYLPMQPGEFLENFANIEKAQKELGWEPKTSMHEGLKRFIGWYKTYHSPSS